MTTEAFCPGHITAIFYAPEPRPRPEMTGSRGAGLCIAHGVRARARALAPQEERVVPDVGTRIAPVVERALGTYLNGSEEDVSLGLGLEIELPVGQGFGMSGAMTLASLLTAEGELGLVEGDLDRLVTIAHASEVESGTGLGDVVAQARGGLDLRVRPGLPPYGEVLSGTAEGEVLVAWAPTPLHTSNVLSDPEARTRLEAAALPLLGSVVGGPGLDWLLEAGIIFCREATLAGPDVLRMLEVCGRYGRASQVMLGNSVFAVGDLERMGQALDDLGFDRTITEIDNRGARTVP